MFRNAHQSGFLSILYSVGASPLAIWDQKVKNGHIRRITDEDVKSLAIEISGTNVATTYIICPADPKTTLGIRLPFLVMIVKNMKKYFTFEIQIMDDKNMSRRFRVSNYQSTTRVRPFCTTMPIGLSSGWNQIQFNLADFTRRAYGSSYLETLRVQIHANVRIRRIYFSDRLYSEDEMPKEFKLYLPLAGTQKRGPKKVEKEVKDQATDPKKISVDIKTEIVEEDVIPSGAPPTPTDSAREEAHEALGEEMTGEGQTAYETTASMHSKIASSEAIPTESGADIAAEEGAEQENIPSEPAEEGEETEMEVAPAVDNELPPEAPSEPEKIEDVDKTEDANIPPESPTEEAVETPAE